MCGTRLKQTCIHHILTLDSAILAILFGSGLLGQLCMLVLLGCLFENKLFDSVTSLSVAVRAEHVLVMWYMHEDKKMVFMTASERRRTYRK